MSDREAINRAVRLLIKRHYQCYDAVAETINDALDKKLGKSTISKRLDKNGDLSWPLEDLMVLQEIADYFPINRMLERHEGRHSAITPKQDCILTSVGVAAIEGGEATSYAAKAAQSLKNRDYKRAVVEAREAAAAYSELAESLEAKIKNGSVVPLVGQIT